MSFSSKKPIILACVIAASLAWNHVASSATVVTGEQGMAFSSPFVATQTSVEFFIDLTDADDGGSISVGNYQVRVELVGPNAGTDVAIIGIDETTSVAHPQAQPIGQIVDMSGTTGIGFTANALSPFDLNDSDGLIRVILEIQPNVAGDYTLNIPTGEGNTLFTDPDDFMTLLPISTSNGSLSVSLTAIPEPSSVAMLAFSVSMLPMIRRRKLRTET